MTVRRNRKAKPMPMEVANNPALYRYASLEECLADNVDLMVRLIQSVEERQADLKFETPRVDTAIAHHRV